MANNYAENECLNLKSGSILKLFQETRIINFLGTHEGQEENIKEEFVKPGNYTSSQLFKTSYLGLRLFGFTLNFNSLLCL